MDPLPLFIKPTVSRNVLFSFNFEIISILDINAMNSDRRKTNTLVKTTEQCFESNAICVRQSLRFMQANNPSLQFTISSGIKTYMTFYDTKTCCTLHQSNNTLSCDKSIPRNGWDFFVCLKRWCRGVWRRNGRINPVVDLVILETPYKGSVMLFLLSSFTLEDLLVTYRACR